MKLNVNASSRLSVAPMMDWTDRHCRHLHRLLSRHALLYTEMVTAPALVRGGAVHLLDHGAAEHPVALQLGGSDPAELAEATRLGAEAGYREINLNVGCPSDRVQSGTFGAVLMKSPDLVAECCAAMRAVTDLPVTVKCRIGVDDQDPHVVLPDFIARVAASGVTRMAIHARMAWLQGLSPKENRDIPPLDYPLVHRMKEAFPALHLSVNGGIDSLDAAEAHLVAGMDGVMIGRAAYHAPAQILCAADRRIFGADTPDSTPEDAARAMMDYAEAHLAQGGRLGQITRHMLGLFAGRPGARSWRRMLSEGAHLPGAGPELIAQALAQVTKAQEAANSDCTPAANPV
ncbi:tRNA dihydrouridine(20/20a) synthase DusA [Roseovarius nanhaiticus]|uniref:tRNA dihydrouridine(20/20a) synthase DusA n=1 Tax=Roseovarius nanhaiticus TaxID=573024 RepID=UPI00249152C0|nr:tRNA dihydrouridine(20/20a) synthase DusA [Roseovarius nanhaiticus]